ncbi:hypothetical protein FACS189426_08940 [Bacteroidia bacterium]|nr:hypothetical protein FACS189426_08940 [Bacteroidia bacterium]
MFAQIEVETVDYPVFAMDNDTVIPVPDSSEQVRYTPVTIDTVIINPFLLPLVFDEKYVWPPVSLLPASPFAKQSAFPPLISGNKLFVDKHHRMDIYRNAYLYIIKNRLDLIKYTKKDFPEKREVLEEIQSTVFQSLFKVDYDLVDDKIQKPERFNPKRRYWIYSGNSLIQFSQNYISENWYKGGIGNLNLLNQQSFSANYKKGKVEFNNFFEWKLSLYTNPKDTLRNTKIGEDLVRLYSTFGIQAAHNWYYSSNIEVKTQLFKNFKENSTNIVSAAISPLLANVGILGMRYQLEKTYPKVRGKKLNFSMDISPLSIQYTYVLSDEVDPARFGIEAGKKHTFNFGSTLNAKYVMFFNKNISFSSRLKYFTNYEKANLELENELNMPINRFFSTRIYLYARFDDSKGLKKDPKLGYLQLNELLSFGFNYKW